MKNIDQKKYELLNIFIENIPLEAKTKKVSELVGNPFYIFDTSLRVLLASSYDDLNGANIIKIDNYYFLNPILFNQILTDDDLKYLENDEILIKQYRNFDKRFIVQRISDGRYTLGYVCIYLEDETLIEENEELMVIGTKALAHELKINGFSNSIEQVVFSRIIDGSLSNKDEIEDALKKINYVSKNQKRLMIIKTNNIQKVCYVINSIDNKDFYFVYKNDILCFVERERDKVRDFINKFINDIEENDCKVGISDIFDEVNELPIAYAQAKEAIEIGEKYEPNNPIIYFNDYRIVSIFKSLNREDLEKSVDRRLRKVIKYDELNNTTYYQDLKTYFDSGRNINKTAEKLYVHKNSIYYRLDKIKNLFDIDIEDENGIFMIELSIKILDLLANFN